MAKIWDARQKSFRFPKGTAILKLGTGVEEFLEGYQIVWPHSILGYPMFWKNSKISDSYICCSYDHQAGKKLVEIQVFFIRNLDQAIVLKVS